MVLGGNIPVIKGGKRPRNKEGGTVPELLQVMRSGRGNRSRYRAKTLGDFGRVGGSVPGMLGLMGKRPRITLCDLFPKGGTIPDIKGKRPRYRIS